MATFIKEFRKFNILMNDNSDIDIYCHDWTLLGYDEEPNDDLISFELHDEESDDWWIIAMVKACDVRCVREFCLTEDKLFKYMKPLYERK